MPSFINKKEIWVIQISGRKHFFVVLCIAASALFIYGCGGKNSKTDVIKIGCAAPLTGDQAQIGIDTCNGVKLASEEANEAGKTVPGFKFEVSAIDDQHNPAQAVNVANKFVSD